MNVHWDSKNETYYVKEKIGNQSYKMGFQKIDKSLDTTYYNVFLAVYSKRKHAAKNEENCLMTGKNPIATIAFARKAFESLEQKIIDQKVRASVSVWGSDSIRRRIYEKYLIPKGYQYNTVGGLRCLQKIYN